MATHWPRRSDRRPWRAQAILRRPGQSNYRVRTRDISLEGCQLEFVDRPVPGNRLWVKFDGLEALPGIVCWVGSESAGLLFDRPIHPAVLEMIAGPQAEALAV